MDPVTGIGHEVKQLSNFATRIAWDDEPERPRYEMQERPSRRGDREFEEFLRFKNRH